MSLDMEEVALDGGSEQEKVINGMYLMMLGVENRDWIYHHDESSSGSKGTMDSLGTQRGHLLSCRSSKGLDTPVMQQGWVVKITAGDLDNKFHCLRHIISEPAQAG